MDTTDSRRDSRWLRRLTRILGPAVLTMCVLIATVQTASAVTEGTTEPPTKSGNNAAGYGHGFTSNDFHDIDRKVCGFWGCNYDDGTNVFYYSDGTGTVRRGMACGTHRYRHQSSDNGQHSRQLTRICT